MKKLVGLTAEECKKAIQVFAKLMCSASSIHVIADRPCAEKKRSLTTLSPSTRKRLDANSETIEGRGGSVTLMTAPECSLVSATDWLVC